MPDKDYIVSQNRNWLFNVEYANWCVMAAEDRDAAYQSVLRGFDHIDA